MAKVVVEAGERACIEQVRALRDELLQAFSQAKSNDTIVFNISRVQKTDSSFAQLLISAELEARERDLLWEVHDKKGDKTLTSMLLCSGSCNLCLRGHRRTNSASTKGKAL